MFGQPLRWQMKMRRGTVTNVDQATPRGVVAIQGFVRLVCGGIGTGNPVAIVINGGVAAGRDFASGVHVHVLVVAIGPAPMRTSKTTIGHRRKIVSIRVGDGQVVVQETMDQASDIGCSTGMTGLKHWKNFRGGRFGRQGCFFSWTTDWPNVWPSRRSLRGGESCLIVVLRVHLPTPLGRPSTRSAQQHGHPRFWGLCGVRVAGLWATCWETICNWARTA